MLRFLTKGKNTNKLAKAIKTLKPSKVAVAYIGLDWKKFIDVESLDEIIVSPTIGSNPRAILDLKDALGGWRNVYFLKNLHAKMYIGENKLILGSANLSNNGLDVDGLQEACIEIETEGRKTLNAAEKFFEELKELAKKEFPTDIEKKQAISDLNAKWNQGFEKNLFSKKNKNRLIKLDEYVPSGKDDFYIGWWQEPGEDGAQLNKMLISEATQNEDGFDWLSLHPQDNVKPGHFVLIWTMTQKKYKCSKKCKIYWMYINRVRKGVVEKNSGGYTSAMIQNSNEERPPLPFELDDMAQEAFRSIIDKKKYEKFHFNDTDNKGDDIFLFKKTSHRFESFVKDWQAKYRELKSEAK